VVIPRADPRQQPPPLEQLVVVTWNAHLAEGRIEDLVADLRAGRLTDGRPVDRFVLLLQELFRRGSDVPPMQETARAAFGILARDRDAPDITGHARRLGLAAVYVPSMRNGANLSEDRGSAIISTEPLTDLRAVELPFERQRRVALGASIAVQTRDGRERLALMNVHLEPLSKPSSLWFFHNPRRRQIAAVLATLQPALDASVAGTVLGGDFNTVQGGSQEAAYRQARSWSLGLEQEDPRSTHDLGRLDYVFVRLSPEWRAITSRVAAKYGSDHHPVLARFLRRTGD
jgi:endonuclease/exonuclease/phosphatase family metal-dependent hydrolase